MRRERRKARKPADDWKILSLVFVSAAIPTLGTITLMRVSSHKSLAHETFLHGPDSADTAAVDWSMLGRWSDGKESTPSAPVYVPGYMLPFDEAVDAGGLLTRFLLVPDPGNWIHPPHLDSDSVIVVRMDAGAKTRLVVGRPVWVRGKLSFARVKTDRLAATLQLDASSIEEAGERK